MQRRYDEFAERGDRLKRSYIGTYSYLIENLYRKNYDWKEIAADHPFMVQDVLFNSVLCQAEEDLGSIADSLDLDGSFHRQRARDMRTAINGKLWNEREGIYYDFDLAAGNKSSGIPSFPTCRCSQEFPIGKGADG